METVIVIALTVLALAILALLLGLALALAGKVFAVKKDPRIGEIVQCLAGANCGGCGYAGCSAYAEAIVSQGAPVNCCPVGGKETADAIGAIMGVTAQAPVRLRAQVMCSGTTDLARRKYAYRGISDCLSVAKLGNGPKECPYGCIGLGSCVHVCPFGAIKVENGVAAVEYEKCRACGACVSVCPQHLIKLVPFDTDVWVGCRSQDKGPVVRNYCQVGCIGCGICVRNCPSGAISVQESVASIDYSKCIDCGLCAEKCPRNIIWSGKKQMAEGDTLTVEGKQ